MNTGRESPVNRQAEKPALNRCADALNTYTPGNLTSTIRRALHGRRNLSPSTHFLCNLSNSLL
jgi:hypothetical protein